MYKKKSLGQHFLHNRHYLEMVADAADITKGEVIVEIGPGDGALTEVLLQRSAHVIAIEKDTRLIPILKEKFKNYDISKFDIIEADALQFDISNYFPSGKIYTVVGNIPYYITGALLKKFLSAAHQPTCLVFLVQKEVAERITGHPSTRSGSQKESILSLSVKAYGTPRYVKTVPRGAFAPPPKVDSAILAVVGISRKHFTSPAHEQKFFELVKKGFSSKRKLLRNNLGKEHTDILEDVGVSPKARAEDVPLAQWLALAAK